MKMNFKGIFVFVLALGFLFLPGLVSAHQPRIVNWGEIVNISNPEVSQVFYGKLDGIKQVYKISSPVPFNLYVNMTLPDTPGQKKDVGVLVYKNNATSPFLSLGGVHAEWSRFWEPFGRDWYWQNDWYLNNPQYDKKVEAGEYTLVVQSDTSLNNSKYALVVGEKEKFGFVEGIKSILVIPQIKRIFFNESPAGFIFSPLGYGYVIVMFVLAFLFGLVYRVLLRKSAKSTNRRAHKNIDGKDRLIRALLAVALFAWAITTTWNPILFFLSGFCVFEAVFSWCGLYAAMGKSSCPV